MRHTDKAPTTCKSSIKPGSLVKVIGEIFDKKECQIIKCSEKGRQLTLRALFLGFCLGFDH